MSKVLLPPNKIVDCLKLAILWLNNCDLLPLSFLRSIEDSMCTCLMTENFVLCSRKIT